MRFLLLVLAITSAYIIKAQQHTEAPLHANEHQPLFKLMGSVYVLYGLPNAQPKSVNIPHPSHYLYPNTIYLKSYKIGASIGVVTGNGIVSAGPALQIGFQTMHAEHRAGTVQIKDYDSWLAYAAPGFNIFLRGKNLTGMVNMSYAYGLINDNTFSQPEGFMPSIGFGYKSFLATAQMHMATNRLLRDDVALGIINPKMKQFSLGITFLM